MIYELIFPSGHRQVWKSVEIRDSSEYLYECKTFSPEGDLVDFRISASDQFERTQKRVVRLGGKVRELATDETCPL